ncbi:uncharacterized protein LOC116620697 [Nematostella vectensis]|uniref:uncharacterized protein LOC116620697 n=1 Tax=Nematostella vectensis TaxID=45351 RepID=UPI0020770DA7|nr:uncharacterized protein LOC116620697 [Nematostella vectensis]
MGPEGVLVSVLLLVAAEATKVSRGDERSNEAVFKKLKTSQVLSNSTLEIRKVKSPTECAINCMSHQQCQSFNYQEGGSTHACELTSKPASETTKEDFKCKAGYSYYGVGDKVSQLCSRSSCKNGGTCVETACNYKCLCGSDTYGKDCSLWKDGLDGYELLFRQPFGYSIQDVSNEDLSAFTICFWALFNGDGYSTFAVFSYSVPLQPKSIVLERVQSNSVLTIVGQKKLFWESPFYSNFELTHYCIKWNSTGGVWTVYVNGAKMAGGSNLQSNAVIPGNGKFVLGRGVASMTGNEFGFTADGFEGIISDLNMWDHELEIEQIKQVFNCKNLTGNVIEWRGFKSNVQGEAISLPAKCPNNDNETRYALVFANKSSKSSLQYKDIPILKEFYLTFWIRTSDSSVITIFSYTTDEGVVLLSIKFDLRNNLINMDLLSQAVQRDYTDIAKLQDGEWHYIVVTLIRGYLYVYLDRNSVAYFYNSELSEKGIPANATLHIGQYINSTGIHESEGFVGMLEGLTVLDVYKHYTRPVCTNIGNALTWKQVLQLPRRGNISATQIGGCKPSQHSKDFSMYFPRKSADDYLTMAIPLNYRNSVCFWAQTNVGDVAFFSYQGPLGLEMALVSGKRLEMTYLVKGKSQTDSRTWFGDSLWHHMCTTWSFSKTYPRNHLFYDGAMRASYDDLSSSGKVMGKGNFSIGKVDFGNGTISSFTGNITRFNVWTLYISLEFIHNMATLVEDGDGQFHELSWANFASHVSGDIKIIDQDDLMSVKAQENNYEVVFHSKSEENYVKYVGMSNLLALTLCLWAWSSGSTDGKLFAYSDGQGIEMGMGIDNATIRFRINNSILLNITSMTDTNTSLWHHVCVTWEAINGAFTAYYDGYKKNSTIAPLGSKINGGGTILLGQSFKGKISHFDIWDMAMESVSVAQLSTGCGTWSGNALNWYTLRRDASFIGDISIKQFSSCDLPGLVVLSSRNEHCEKFQVCNAKPRALFDVGRDGTGRKWRCYAPSAVTKTTLNQGVKYNVALNSTCYRDENEALVKIND